MNSISSKATCHEIDLALWKIGSTDFVEMCKKDQKPLEGTLVLKDNLFMIARSMRPEITLPVGCWIVVIGS